MREEISTTEALDQLAGATKENIDDLIKANGKELPDKSYLISYLAEKNIPTSKIVSRCQGYITKSYIYDLVNGKKLSPSRDITIMLALGCEMDYKATRRLLENYGHRALYPKDARDMIIATCINNGVYDVARVNEELVTRSLSPLE